MTAQLRREGTAFGGPLNATTRMTRKLNDAWLDSFAKLNSASTKVPTIVAAECTVPPVAVEIRTFSSVQDSTKLAKLKLRRALVQKVLQVLVVQLF